MSINEQNQNKFVFLIFFFLRFLCIASTVVSLSMLGVPSLFEISEPLFKNKLKYISQIHSWVSRCGTARGSISRLSLGGPTKVKARKFFLFTEGSLKVDFILELSSHARAFYC